MPANFSFDELMAQLRAGDQDAATRVFRRFAERLIGLAYNRLPSAVQQKVGPEDVVQSVFKSFFLRHAQGQFDLGDWDSLWGLLVVITLRKCDREARKYHGPERDLQREAPPLPEDDGDDAGTGGDFLAREPTPLEAAVLAETLEQLLGGLKELECQVALLRLQGYTVLEIGAQVGRTEYTIEAILKKIRKRLQRLRD